MTITEKIAYIKGLAEGLALDQSKPEVKVINAIVDLLDDIAYDLTDMEELYDELADQVDEIDEDLSEVESELYDDDEVEYDEYDDEDNPFYEVTCGACGEKINVSEDVLLEGEIECPNCGELLEFDFSGLFDDEVDECNQSCEVCSGCDEKVDDKAEEKADDADTEAEKK